LFLDNPNFSCPACCATAGATQLRTLARKMKLNS
jgi:hypothetical protein